ncbi:MAG: hypothetical protein R3E67_02900 [Pseudomonadales bacterium]
MLHSKSQRIAVRQTPKQLDELARRAHREQPENPDAVTRTSNSQLARVHATCRLGKAIEQRKQQALCYQSAVHFRYPHQHTASPCELCIAVEILLDLATPEADRQLRRELQLKKLQQGLGQAPLGGASAALEQLLIDWHCTGSANTEEQTTLQTRFSAALSQARKAR